MSHTPPLNSLLQTGPRNIGHRLVNQIKEARGKAPVASNDYCAAQRTVLAIAHVVFKLVLVSLGSLSLYFLFKTHNYKHCGGAALGLATVLVGVTKGVRYLDNICKTEEDFESYLSNNSPEIHKSLSDLKKKFNINPALIDDAGVRGIAHYNYIVQQIKNFKIELPLANPKLDSQEECREFIQSEEKSFNCALRLYNLKMQAAFVRFLLSHPFFPQSLNQIATRINIPKAERDSIAIRSAYPTYTGTNLLRIKDTYFSIREADYQNETAETDLVNKIVTLLG